MCESAFAQRALRYAHSSPPSCFQANPAQFHPARHDAASHAGSQGGGGGAAGRWLVQGRLWRRGAELPGARVRHTPSHPPRAIARVSKPASCRCTPAAVAHRPRYRGSTHTQLPSQLLSCRAKPSLFRLPQRTMPAYMAKVGGGLRVGGARAPPVRAGASSPSPPSKAPSLLPSFPPPSIEPLSQAMIEDMMDSDYRPRLVCAAAGCARVTSTRATPARASSANVWLNAWLQQLPLPPPFMRIPRCR